MLEYNKIFCFVVVSKNIGIYSLKILKKSLNKWMELDFGIVMSVVNQDILKPNLINTKKNLVSLLKNMNLFD